MKKTVKTVLASILSLSAILTASSCGAQTAREVLPAAAVVEASPVQTVAAAETTVSSRLEALETELNTVSSLEEAEKVVADYTNRVESCVLNNDFDGFKRLYCIDDDDMLREAFNSLTSVIGSYDKDYTVLFFDGDEICFTNMYYRNEINENGESSSNSKGTDYVALINTEEGWKSTIDMSESFKADWDLFKLRTYGQRAAETGFCSGDYQIVTSKALLSNVNAYVKSAVMNSDGSMTLVLGIENGYNINKKLTKLTGTIEFGKDNNSLFTVIDLSRSYSCPDNLSNLYLPAKSVTFVTVTVAQHSFVNPVSDNSQITGQCSSHFDSSYCDA